jgi:hypothetical protein
MSDSPHDLNLYKIFNNNDSGTLGVSDCGFYPNHVNTSKDIHTLADVEEKNSKTVMTPLVS